ncbi:uncharacterized protein GGS22DRAFT_19201 [Annulohypoxylon maeteangense]|uniref:uncharacterized protein n=1 Tax=Annulohypoxylon maeteangense TaxID=1927788 RepID=UPI002007C409|nr:uncharacterized protein GGS22DRAFT_19201 [Annulohypoxylon maeteangense]KAI0884107.1 hypothetical protein GGS22DRAFT_19201 [Annulohypoxylon maeteangense]
MPVETARPSFYLLPPERLLPASALSTWLGRIVKCYSEPDANFVPVDPTPFITHPFATSIITNANLATLSQRNKALAATLGTSAIHASRQTSNGGGLSFSSSEVVCVRLQDHDGVFDKLSQHVETRTQLARMLARGGNAGFMVTAVLIWRDAAFTHSRERGVETSASVAVPVSTIVTSTTGIMLPSELTDPSISGSHSRQDTAEVSGESIGSHIFALQYKTVRRSVIQSFLRMNNSIMLREKGPDLPASQSFAQRDRWGSDRGSDDEDEDSSEDESEDESSKESFSDDDDAAGIGNDVNVVLEMDEDDVTWADVLDEDEGEEMERADVVIGGEEIQFVF